MHDYSNNRGRDLSPFESFMTLTVFAVGVTTHVASHFGLLNYTCACAGGM